MLSTYYALAIDVLDTLFSSCMTTNKDAEISATVQICYGMQKALRDTLVTVNVGVTALDALQYVATVETYLKGKPVFVKSVDSVEGVRGVMA